MRTLINGLMQLLLVAALAGAAWWAWQTFGPASGSRAASGQVSEIDKRCSIISADTGQCVCRHARTGERLDLPYEECRERARGR